jgi:hypothetical protein
MPEFHPNLAGPPSPLGVNSCPVKNAFIAIAVLVLDLSANAVGQSSTKLPAGSLSSSGVVSSMSQQCASAPPDSAPAETPRERFYRRGGRTIQAKTIFLENGELTSASIKGPRQIQQYANGGHFDCGRFPVPEAARDFIWTHWQAKTRGYIRLTFHSVDAVSTSHIFIEPDSGGVWRIVRRIVRHTNEIDDLPTIRRVERMTINERTRLVFIAADGEEEETL